MRILANPALLRAMVVLFCAAFAFLIGLLSIRFLRQQIADEADTTEEAPKSVDKLPMQLYNTVIQQLKEQKRELLERFQAEQQRGKIADVLNQMVLSNLPCGVVMFGPNGLAKTFNPAAKSILGFASVSGMSAEDIFRGATLVDCPSQASGDAEPQALAAEVNAVLRERQSRKECEVEYETPAGNKRSLAITVSPAAPDGNLLGVACLITDLSQFADLRQKSEPNLEADMVRQLRRSLRLISGYAEQLAVSRDAEHVQRLAEHIIEQATQSDRNIGTLVPSGSSETAAAASVAAGS